MNINIWDIVVIAAVAAAVVYALRRIKKKGMCSCGGNCDGCAMRGECREKNNL